MKLSIPSLLASCLAGICLVAVGCSDSGSSDVISDPPPSIAAASDDGHDHAHDHKHGLNGYPVVDLDDGTEVEWDFDEDIAAFLLIPPADVNEKIEEAIVKTVVDGTETTYAFEKGEEAGTWTLQNEELGTAMMMGDAVERTLIITLDDGKALTASVAHFEGH